VGLVLTTGVAACQDSVPIKDLCVSEADTPDFCTPKCASDADCVVGGNPCCNAQHQWYCYNNNIAGLSFCDATCDFIPENPGDERCLCVDGFCRGQ